MFLFAPSRILCILLASGFLSACAARSPYLNPIASDTDSSSGSKQVVVEIKPIVTSGFRNPERERLGIDLSAYYTAFEVTVRNHTSQPVSIDAQDAVLLDENRNAYAVLSAEESIDYYQSGGMTGDRAVLVPKSLAIAKEEMARIRQLRLRSGEIAPEEFKGGIVLFHKIPGDKCHRVELTLRGVRITGEDKNREFRFSFSCDAS